MEIHTRVLSESLVKRGHRVTVLTTSIEPMKELRREENDVKVHYLPVPHPGQYSDAYWKQSAALFKQLHEKNPFDIVWSESASAAGLVKLMNHQELPPVLTVLQGGLQGAIVTAFRTATSRLNGCYTVLRNMPFWIWRHIIWTTPLLRASKMVICPSPQTVSEVRHDTWLPRSKFLASVNGIDCNLFRPNQQSREEVRAALGFGDETVILNVGRLARDKGVSILLRAMADLKEDLPKAVLVIIGSGGERSRLESLARELRIEQRTRFLGFVPNEELPSYYNACDLFVCPTVRVESFGIVLAEAMACGKPVISSATGGTKSVVTNGESGVLVPVKNRVALAKAILDTAIQPELLKNLGAAARKRAVAMLSSDRMVDDFLGCVDVPNDSMVK